MILSTILEIEIAIVLQISHLQRQLMNVYMKSEFKFVFFFIFILCILLSAERGKLMYPNCFHDEGIAQKLTQWQQFKAVNSIVTHTHTHTNVFKQASTVLMIQFSHRLFRCAVMVEFKWLNHFGKEIIYILCLLKAAGCNKIASKL